MCELSEFLKKTLIAAGRKDVFIHYNDGPASGNLKGNGMCKGLDYFSIDSYNDDPAAEVAASKTAYAPLIPQLRPPNDYEPNGQGLWVVPGIFCEWPAISQSVRVASADSHILRSQCFLLSDTVALVVAQG